MRHICLLAFIFFSIARCFSQSIPVPTQYAIIDSAYGDLDKDGIEELVVAYNTKSNEDEIANGVARELIIYKKENAKWTIWQRSMQALYGSRDGGMMGDPFGEILIKNGILTISHDGGSSWKWAHTDKYRYDGKVFKLIGYEDHYGKLCEDWMHIDFNLITGKLVVKKEYEPCEDADQKIYKQQNEVFFKKGITITLQNRNDKEIKIISPKYRHEIYIAIKLD